MKNKRLLFTAVLLLLLSLTGCADREVGSPMDLKTDEALVIYCPHPLDFINPVVSEFEERTGIRVQVQTGGTGELLEMVAEQKQPRCDIFWGGSLSTTIERRELFAPYISENENMVRPEFCNVEGNMTRFTDVPSVLMVNTNLIGDISIRGYEDLLQPQLRGRIAMAAPAVSSSSYEHLINMLYAMGHGDPENGWDYVEAFCANLDGNLLESSSAVYKGVAEGRYTVGLTFEEGAAHYVAGDSAAVKLVYMEEGVISKPDVVCIAAGAEHMDEARAFVDFVTGRDAQTMIATTLDRRSVRTDVEEPDYLPDKDSIYIIYDDPAVVNENKQRWLARFDEIFRATLTEGGKGADG